jgi:hypothetical protein
MELLTLSSLKTAARDFCTLLSATQIPNLYGVTDGNYDDNNRCRKSTARVKGIDDAVTGDEGDKGQTIKN